jgi:hypothetical protein
MIVTRGLDGEKGLGEGSFVGPPHLVTQAADAMWSGKAR